MAHSTPNHPATPDREKLIEEIKANYEKFKAMNFGGWQKGKFALLRHGELVEVLENKTDAHKYARLLYDDGIYSIQEIHAKPVDLGSMSYAVR